MSRFKSYKNESSVRYRKTEISRSVVEEFLEDVTHTPACPECGKDFWRVIVTPGNGEFMVIPAVSPDVRDDDEDEVSNYLTIAVVNCDNCGYVKSFTLRTIRLWMEKKRKAESEDDDA